jgi:hypothetical protein
VYRYQPPKASVWGHLLRKMPASRAHSVLNEFLGTAAGHHQFHSASASIRLDYRNLEARFEALLGVTARNSGFSGLTLEQSNSLVQEVIRLEASSPEEARAVSVSQTYLITQWIVDGAPVATRSRLTMRYGWLPGISTRFWFDTIPQFHSVSRIMQDLRICKLNEKHLKQMSPKDWEQWQSTAN